VAETPNDEEKLSVAQNGSSVEKHAERATRNASPWIERLARAG
jgi:hypothetical protein